VVWGHQRLREITLTERPKDTENKRKLFLNVFRLRKTAFSWKIPKKNNILAKGQLKYQRGNIEKRTSS
jgi:hypothetical protein